MLNLLWSGFFIGACLVAVLRFGWAGDLDIFARMVQAILGAARTGFEIALGLTGAMALWMGLMRIGEQAGLIDSLTHLLKPLFRRLFPDVPDQHPALGSMTMNLAANMLGLDNAATPLGIRAMQDLQSLNPDPTRITDAQALFLVLNTAMVTLVPVSVLTYRAQAGAADPADVFVPILLAGACGTLAGVTAAGLVQGLRWRDPLLLGSAALLSTALALLVAGLLALPPELQGRCSSAIGNALVLTLIAGILIAALRRRIDAHAAFIEGARAGFDTAVRIVPHLVAMLTAIAALRACGALEALTSGLRWLLTLSGLDARPVDALPTAVLKSLSGSAARATMIDAMRVHGADSYTGRLVSILQGSSETTFYVLAVYAGAVGVRYTRHVLPCALFADAIAVLAAIVICTLFFG